jgi:uncharacterized protein (DUF58 family)
VVGLLSGTAGVVVARVLFGPGKALTGAAIGLVIGVPASLWAGSSWRRRQRAPRLANGRRLRRSTHPVAWVGPVFGSGITVVAWSAVAHSSGSGWVQAVGALLAAVLVTGLIAPGFPARRSRVTCVAGPSDVTAGQPATVILEANGPLRIRPLEPGGPVARAVGRTRGSREVAVEVVPARRGVLDSVAVELASSAPFGLVWWAREVVVPLSRPMHVAPRLGPPEPIEPGTDDRPGDADRRVAALTGEVRGIRPYQVGDLRRTIHWPATAHTGVLMVAEAERPVDQPVVVEVDLPPDLDAAERAAERAMTVGSAWLARGVPVVLVTREPGGPVVRPVVDRVELGRRLARAVPAGPVGAGGGTP